MENTRLETIFFFVLLVAALILVFYIFWPFLSVLILAGTLAIIFGPIYQKLNKFLRSEITAALLTVFIVLILVLAPLTYVGYRIFNEATDFYSELTAGGGIGNLSAAASTLIKDLAHRFRFQPVAINFGEYLRQLVLWLVENLGQIFTGFAGALLKIFLGLLGFFYLLKDGERLKAKMVSLLPLPLEYSETIFSRLGQAVNSVIRGQLVISILQGIMVGLGLMIFGVPNAVIWGSVGAIAALVPTFGTSLVIVPAVVYLLLNDNVISGLGLLVWGLLGAGLIDNFLSPYLIKRGVKIHPFLILLSVLGGITLMGPIGFLAGPLVLSFLFALLDIYPILIPKK